MAKQPKRVRRKVAETMTLADQIRRAVNECGTTQYKLCQQLAMDRGQMSRFMAGKTFLRELTLNRLAAALSLTVVVVDAKRNGR